MASVSISHLVIFIASLVVAASVAGTLVAGVDRISGSVTDRSWDLSEQIGTDVTVISDAGSDAIYENGTIILLVKNTGSVNLAAHPSQLDVLVNGQYAPNVTVESLDGDDWRTGSVVLIEVEKSLDSGDHRVTILVNKNEAIFQFRL